MEENSNYGDKFGEYQIVDTDYRRVKKEFVEKNWKCFECFFNILPLSYIPQEKLTYEKCLKEVEKNWRTLEEVPEGLKTYNLCMDAVKNNGCALEYVPDELKTYDLCLV